MIRLPLDYHGPILHGTLKIIILEMRVPSLKIGLDIVRDTIQHNTVVVDGAFEHSELIAAQCSNSVGICEIWIQGNCSTESIKGIVVLIERSECHTKLIISVGGVQSNRKGLA